MLKIAWKCVIEGEYEFLYRWPYKSDSERGVWVFSKRLRKCAFSFHGRLFLVQPPSRFKFVLSVLHSPSGDVSLTATLDIEPISGVLHNWDFPGTLAWRDIWGKSQRPCKLSTEILRRRALRRRVTASTTREPYWKSNVQAGCDQWPTFD